MASRPTRQHVNPLKVRICVSEKVGYDSYALALDACETLMLTGKVQPGCHQTPYACQQCGEWHTFNRRIVAVES